ncbi:hypothetical protein [Mycobacterium sp.]|uniref:hypothetical protein n=1 Tax=Mycobacterium sp. TaxID=1785 RepID=UPI003C74A546
MPVGNDLHPGRRRPAGTEDASVLGDVQCAVRAEREPVGAASGDDSFDRAARGSTT